MTEIEKKEDVEPQVSELLTPGVMLRQAREAKALDVRAAADQLRMSRVKLVALEADAYAEFQGETFIRGYIKAYSRILALDENAVIARYEAYMAAKAEVEPLVIPKVIKPLGLAFNDKRKLKPIYVGMFFLAVLLVSVVVILFQQGFLLEDERLVTQQDSVVMAESLDKVTALEQTESLVSPLDTPESDGLISEQDAGVVVASPAVSDDGLVNSTQSAFLFDTLTILVKEECWIEVSDAKGDVLATELKEAGSEVVLQGRAPFNVMLGNARSATVFINGSLVDSNPRNTNRALRFTVEKP